MSIDDVHEYPDVVAELARVDAEILRVPTAEEASEEDDYRFAALDRVVNELLGESGGTL